MALNRQFNALNSFGNIEIASSQVIDGGGEPFLNAQAGLQQVSPMGAPSTGFSAPASIFDKVMP